mgnify:CR=1 FL=1
MAGSAAVHAGGGPGLLHFVRNDGDVYGLNVKPQQIRICVILTCSPYETITSSYKQYSNLSIRKKGTECLTRCSGSITWFERMA